MARLLTVEDFLSAPRGEVPIVYAFARRDPDEPGSIGSRTKTVPVEWYEEIRRAFEAHARLRSANVPGVVGSFISPGGYDEGVTIAVETSESDARDDLTEVLKNLLSGVTFDVTEIGDIPPASDENEIEQWTYLEDVADRRVPGGVACEGSAGWGSLAPAVYDTETGERFFATSNHVFGSQGEKRTEHRGEPLYLVRESSRTRIGTVERGYPEADVVRVRPDGGYIPESRIHGTYPGRVVGHFSKFGLADLKARGVRLRKFGAASSRTVGEITGVDGTTCFTGEICKDGQLKWGHESSMTDGDSGSVSYAPDPENPEENFLVAGINNARTWWPGSDYTWGTAAYHLYHRYGLAF